MFGFYFIQIPTGKNLEFYNQKKIENNLQQINVLNNQFLPPQRNITCCIKNFDFQIKIQNWSRGLNQYFDLSILNQYLQIREMNHQYPLKQKTELSSQSVMEQTNYIFNITKATEDKVIMISKELEKLQESWNIWTNQQMGILTMNNTLLQKLKLKVDITECTQSEGNQTPDGEKQELINKQLLMNKHIQLLRMELIDQKGYQLMTQHHIQKFFEEFQEELANKMHLFGDIQKLKHFSNYDDANKSVDRGCKSVSKEKIIILKKWLLENYLTPHPTSEQVDFLSSKTGLQRKQIMNWFITARNSFTKKNFIPKKFKTQVKQRFQEIIPLKYN